MDLQTKVVLRSFSANTVFADSNWGTEPALVMDGIYVSRTVVPGDRFTDIPVRVMNVRSEELVINAGTRVADLQPVTVLGSIPVCETGGIPVSCRNMNVEIAEGEEPTFIRDLVNGVHDSLSESVCTSLKDVLTQYSDVFSKSPSDMGLTDLVTHHIDTGDAKPVRQQLRRYPPAHAEAISRQIDDFLEQGVIEPASSPWASNIVLVRKKDGSYRCCVDYRRLNSVTRKDAYPLPRIDSCLDAMASAQWFSMFDLRSAYHQVLVNPEDSDKTAFICPRGMYKFRTVPFGLCNAGATFQRLMDVVMSGLHFQVCLVYLDDIIIFSETTDQHLERLVIILKRLRSACLLYTSDAADE